MGSAVWLIIATPQWFFETITAPFSMSMLTLVPSIGIVCLVLAIALGAFRRQVFLLWFLAPFLFSEIFVAIAGLFRGDLHHPDWLLLAFLAAQLVLCGYIANVHAKRAIAAWLLVVFSMIYSLWASFIASMAFQDSWL